VHRQALRAERRGDFSARDACLDRGRYSERARLQRVQSRRDRSQRPQTPTSSGRNRIPERIGPAILRGHPIVRRFLQNGATEPFRLKDCLSAREWGRSALYNECFRTFDCHDQMEFVWGSGPVRFGLPLNRSKGEFSDSDRQMLSLLQPHIIQAHANVLAFARLSQAVETLHGTVLLASARGRIDYATPRGVVVAGSIFWS
jgi:hypothetical protein